MDAWGQNEVAEVRTHPSEVDGMIRSNLANMVLEIERRLESSSRKNRKEEG